MAAAFRLEHEAARRKATLLGALTAEVARVAAGLGAPIVLLKFAALRALGRLPDGLRGAGDVDVLAAPDRAPALAEALGTLGFRPAGFFGEEYQLPQLRDARGRAVEIHVHVPGLRPSLGGPRSTVDALAASGLLQRIDLPGECWVPRPHVLVAHAVTHALVHHGFAPEGYPAFRLVSDLIALGAHEDSALARAALPLVADEMAPGEMEAAVALTNRLVAGDPSLFEPASASSPEGVLLRHFVAGPLDPDYTRATRLRGVLTPSGAGSRQTGLLHETWRALFLTDAQIDILYGAPRSRLGYFGWRLARPFDLLFRAARYVTAWARDRLRRQRQC